MDLTNDLYFYSAKHNLLLIGKYENVKKTTQIKFYCLICMNEQEKKFKQLLSQSKNNLSPEICFSCFMKKNK